jgi:thymidylate synthase ThyX
VLDGAKAMAMTVIDLWADARLRDEVAAQFARRPAEGQRALSRPRVIRGVGHPGSAVQALAVVTVYVPEEFTPAEADVLRRYFTNLDGPVFALVNLPEVVKGALFARYSRSPKSLRRLFLDEFVGDLDISGDDSVDATIGLERAEELYEKVFFEYGDDSVAQLGGVHLACEQASNLLTKMLEWGRLMSYLEQSTRYIGYDSRLGGRYRYFRDPALLSSRFGTRYVGDMDRMFDAYSLLLTKVTDHVRDTVPRDPADSDFVYRQATRAKALDAVRGVLPASSLSNVGIYGTGQAFESLLLRMKAHPLPEAQHYADLMLHELRKVIPSFLRRVDLARPRWALDRLPRRHPPSVRATWCAALFGDTPVDHADAVQLVDFDPMPRTSSSPRSATRTATCPSTRWPIGCGSLGADERASLIRAYVGERENRRHKPGRAFERVDYRFDVLADYGAFRDMQRHRMLTIEWQPLTPNHGYVRPELIDEAGMADVFDDAMARSAALYDALRDEFPSRRAMRCRWPTGCATRCSSMRVRRSTCSSCDRRRRATRRIGGSPSRCTG